MVSVRAAGCAFGVYVATFSLVLIQFRKSQGVLVNVESNWGSLGHCRKKAPEVLRRRSTSGTSSDVALPAFSRRYFTKNNQIAECGMAAPPLGSREKKNCNWKASLYGLARENLEPALPVRPGRPSRPGRPARSGPCPANRSYVYSKEKFHLLANDKSVTEYVLEFRSEMTYYFGTPLCRKQ